MRRELQGCTTVTLALAAMLAKPADAVGQSAGAVRSTVSADSGHKHHHGTKQRGKHTGERRLSYDAATNTVTFKLVAGRAKGPSRLNFNGYSNGAATLAVPSRSHLVIAVVNKDSVPHSAAIIEDREPLPTNPEPAIPGAATKDLGRGLPREGTDTIRFTAPTSGSYRIVSGVPGQARSGMWIRLRVDPAAMEPAWLKNP
jgi:sulfocyanin